jgi:cell division protein FtsI (penicillin-binding protein 3)
VVNYEDPTPANRNGTGRPARSDLITIAGKTGTAQIAGGGGYGMYGHNVSFCGYFPYENPQYTCIVVISRPRNGIPSGGAMCGTVVKDIAEKIYAGKMTLDMSTVTADMPKVVYPQVKNGDYNATKNAASSLSLTTNEEKSIQTPFVLTSANTRGITIREMPSSNGLVPNVVGMGAKDAVFALEGLGLRVLLSGQGRVVSQSVQGGARLVSGQRVTLTLR